MKKVMFLFVYFALSMTIQAIVVNPGSGPYYINQTINFQPSCTAPSQQSPYYCSCCNWNFGDGNSSTSENPSNTYAAQGSYVVNLTVTSINNCTDTISQVITANPPTIAEGPRMNLPLLDL